MDDDMVLDGDPSEETAPALAHSEGARGNVEVLVGMEVEPSVMRSEDERVISYAQVATEWSTQSQYHTVQKAQDGQRAVHGFQIDPTEWTVEIEKAMRETTISHVAVDIEGGGSTVNVEGLLSICFLSPILDDDEQLVTVLDRRSVDHEPSAEPEVESFSTELAWELEQTTDEGVGYYFVEAARTATAPDKGMWQLYLLEQRALMENEVDSVEVQDRRAAHEKANRSVRAMNGNALALHAVHQYEREVP